MEGPGGRRLPRRPRRYLDLSFKAPLHDVSKSLRTDALPGSTLSAFSSFLSFGCPPGSTLDAHLLLFKLVSEERRRCCIFTNFTLLQWPAEPCSLSPLSSPFQSPQFNRPRCYPLFTFALNSAYKIHQQSSFKFATSMWLGRKEAQAEVWVYQSFSLCPMPHAMPRDVVDLPSLDCTSHKTFVSISVIGRELFALAERLRT